jgi:hypothetical protein
MRRGPASAEGAARLNRADIERTSAPVGTLGAVRDDDLLSVGVHDGVQVVRNEEYLSPHQPCLQGELHACF